ncbi:MAG: hypothetical protein OEL53_00590 [Rhodospirillales bacterium]|nr:hypothetical protein [Rhodospirillales bacterium]
MDAEVETAKPLNRQKIISASILGTLLSIPLAFAAHDKGHDIVVSSAKEQIDATILNLEPDIRFVASLAPLVCLKTYAKEIRFDSLSQARVSLNLIEQQLMPRAKSILEQASPFDQRTRAIHGNITEAVSYFDSNISSANLSLNMALDGGGFFEQMFGVIGATAHIATLSDTVDEAERRLNVALDSLDSYASDLKAKAGGSAQSSNGLVLAVARHYIKNGERQILAEYAVARAFRVARKNVIFARYEGSGCFREYESMAVSNIEMSLSF